MSKIDLEKILDSYQNKYTEEFQKENSKVVILEAMKDACREVVFACNNSASVAEDIEGNYFVTGILNVIDKIE